MKKMIGFITLLFLSTCNPWVNGQEFVSTANIEVSPDSAIYVFQLPDGTTALTPNTIYNWNELVRTGFYDVSGDPVNVIKYHEYDRYAVKLDSKMSARIDCSSKYSKQLDRNDTTKVLQSELVSDCSMKIDTLGANEFNLSQISTNLLNTSNESEQEVQVMTQVTGTNLKIDGTIRVKASMTTLEITGVNLRIVAYLGSSTAQLGKIILVN